MVISELLSIFSTALVFESRRVEPSPSTLLKAVLGWAAVISAIFCLDALAFSNFLWAADNEACWLTTTAAPLTNWPDKTGPLLGIDFWPTPKSFWNCFAALVNCSSVRFLNSGFNSHIGTWLVLPWDLTRLPSALNFGL